MLFRTLSVIFIIGLSLCLAVDIMHKDAIQICIDVFFLLWNGLYLITDKS
ncbi:hypothetical protein J2X82_005942 [Priestia megaterium]|nr:hypothetical protein [Priestia megaterium]